VLLNLLRNTRRRREKRGLHIALGETLSQLLSWESAFAVVRGGSAFSPYKVNPDLLQPSGAAFVRWLW
jgi:hypothetical protein